MNFIKLSCFAFILFCFSCSDSCDDTIVIPNLSSTDVYDSNIADIKAYIASNNLNAQETASGLHYVVEAPGEGDVKPTLCDVVEVTYSGYLLNGNVFDGGTIPFQLSNVITGWQEGISLFGKNGKGTLLIPSYLGYGINPPPNTIIGVNEVLVFDIELHNF